MDTASKETLSFEIEQLLGEPASCDGRLNEQEQDAFFNAYSTIENNLGDLAEYTNLAEGYAYITSTPGGEALKTAQFECTRYVHNYLASLYSWNEVIRTLVERHTSLEMKWWMFTSTYDEHPRSQYSRKVGFLRGIRTVCQHGDFSCLQFETYNETDNEVQQRLKFAKQNFMGCDLDDMHIYLKHTRQQRREYLVDFIAGFHRTEFQNFYSDMKDWFGIN